MDNTPKKYKQYQGKGVWEMRQAEQTYYYEDVEAGDEFTSPSRMLSESDVMQFAGLTGDFNEIHTSVTYAKENAYGARTVHGMLTLAMANGLYVRSGIFKNSVFLGIDNWKFIKPVKLGDTIWLKLFIQDKRETKDGLSGIMGIEI
jgi:3-hydroxybutyryl-CoA dehydratase